jgi:hypothetical protein
MKLKCWYGEGKEYFLIGFKNYKFPDDFYTIFFCRFRADYQDIMVQVPSHYLMIGWN